VHAIGGGLGAVQHVDVWVHRALDRIEFVQGFADEDGNRVSPAQLGLPPGIPEEVRNVVSLSAIDEITTELTVREYGYPNARSSRYREPA
jgi:hypothetical protein